VPELEMLARELEMLARELEMPLTVMK